MNRRENTLRTVRFERPEHIPMSFHINSASRFGTPSQIDALIRREVERLGRREGGLMMVYGLYPGVPLENIEALMRAMTRYSTYYA